jgi:hypothetical protein
MKTYNHMAFNVTVPPDWQDDTAPEDRNITLVSEDGKDKLFITIMRFADGITKDQAMTTFQHYLEERRNAEMKKSGDQMKLTDVDIKDEGEFMFSRYGGFDAATNRRFVTLITAEKGKLLNFQLETEDTSDEYVNQLSSTIFESVEVN